MTVNNYTPDKERIKLYLDIIRVSQRTCPRFKALGGASVPMICTWIAKAVRKYWIASHKRIPRLSYSIECSVHYLIRQGYFTCVLAKSNWKGDPRRSTHEDPKWHGQTRMYWKLKEE